MQQHRQCPLMQHSRGQRGFSFGLPEVCYEPGALAEHQPAMSAHRTGLTGRAREPHLDPLEQVTSTGQSRTNDCVKDIETASARHTGCGGGCSHPAIVPLLIELCFSSPCLSLLCVLLQVAGCNHVEGPTEARGDVGAVGFMQLGERGVHVFSCQLLWHGEG